LTDLILHAPQFFTSPTLLWKTRLTNQNAEPRTYRNLCRKLILRKGYFARKNEHGKKPEPNLRKLLLEKI